MSSRLIEMSVESVRVHVMSTTHVVILKEQGAERYLPIWIGAWEANAIAMRLQGVTPERPMTHDLLASVLEALGASVREIVIAELTDETFHARLVLVTTDGKVHEIDSRPSDAIALAVRTGGRIYADEDVLERAGVEPDHDDEKTPSSPGPDDERLSVFRDFVNSLDVGPPGEDREGPRREGPRRPEQP
jgi:uncharacterized protein